MHDCLFSSGRRSEIALEMTKLKSWVLRNFAIERPSRFASLKSESRHADEREGQTLRRDTLINPFEIAQDRAHLIDRKASRAARSTPVCAGCG